MLYCTDLIFRLMSLEKQFSHTSPAETTFLGLNIRSLRYHHDDLLVKLQDYKETPDLILLTETWLTENDPLKEYHIDGYHPLESKPRNNGQKRGGVAVYLKRSLQFERINFTSDLECLIIRVMGSNRIVKNFCVVYRPQNSINIFIEDLDKLFAFLRNLKEETLIFGDFNIDTLKPSYEKTKYENLIHSYGYRIRNFQATRVTATSATCLDHVITSSMVETKTITITISDHYAVEFTASFWTSRSEISTEKPIKKRNLNKLKGDQYLNFLFLLDQKLKSLSVITDVDERFETLSKIIMDCLNRFAPEEEISHKNKKESSWITNKVKNETVKRDQLFKIWTLQPNDSNRERYVKQRNRVTKVIRNAKRDHNEKVLGENPNAKTLFGTLKSAQKRNENQPANLPSAQVLNEYFTGIGPSLSAKIKSPNLLDKVERNINSMVISPTNADEISKLITKMKSKNSTGNDEISNKILKLCSPIIDPYLAEAINYAIENRHFPDCLKIAKVIPVFKKGQTDDPSNYRPISLLSPISKVFERVLCKQMTLFYKKNGLFSPNQFGFRSKMSCSSAIMQVTEYIREKMHSQTNGHVCFIDLQKAFDTLDHQILIQKLEKYGYRGPISEIMKSYLSDRRQYVITKKTSSNEKSIKTGVPQGSVLGPFLFLIYINDLPQYCEKSNLTLFADDTSVYNISRNATNDLSEDILQLRKWFAANKLTVNVSKCELITFGSKSVPKLEKAFGEEIPNRKSAKYLGIHLDKNLTFREHANYLTKKLNKFCGLIYKIRHMYQRKFLLQFYHAYVTSVIKYGLLNYGSTRKTHLENIYKVQRRIIRAIFFKKPQNSLCEILTKYTIFNIYELYIIEVVIEVFKQLKSNSPCAYLSTNINYDYNTRRKAKGLLPATTHRTVMQEKSLKNALNKCYNWLKANDLIPSNLMKQSDEQTKNYVRKLGTLYVADNKDLFELFF